MSFHSLEEIAKKSRDSKRPFWETVLLEDKKDREVSYADSFDCMKYHYQCMKEADANYDPAITSNSGLVGKDGALMEQAVQNGGTLCGDFLGGVIAKALKMGESNACMKKIVAAPTAGSCGVIPAVYLSYAEANHIDEDTMTQALFTAAGIGQIIAKRASISGAQGGCQAEIGSASAMAAGGIASLKGGDEETIIHAAAIALKNLLGLVCDPVAGLVEIPCVKRNVTGAVNALTSADMALAGIRSRIPPDEVIDAMSAVGNLLPSCLKETGEGGLAATPTGKAIARRILH